MRMTCVVLVFTCVMFCETEIGVQNYVPKVKVDHVAPDVPLARVKDRLSQVKGQLVECPMVRVLRIDHRRCWDWLTCILQDFLIDQKDFTEGPEWSYLNPTLPIYI